MRRALPVLNSAFHHNLRTSKMEGLKKFNSSHGFVVMNTNFQEVQCNEKLTWDNYYG